LTARQKREKKGWLESCDTAEEKREKGVRRIRGKKEPHAESLGEELSSERCIFEVCKGEQAEADLFWSAGEKKREEKLSQASGKEKSTRGSII